MKIAVIGSRSLIIQDFSKVLPPNTTEIISGGAKGIDSCAKDYAQQHNIKFTVFLPQYEEFGRLAPIVRNNKIVDYADEIIAFWDGKSKGTLYTINKAKKSNVKCTVYVL